ncbi:septum formation protein Maf [bacterium]|nr:MAG: septum formation protein Maf [bacterium]
MPSIVLASASPRRSQLLGDLGVAFTVAPSAAIEPPPTQADRENPGAYVETLARLKGQSDGTDSIFIGADTVVVIDNDILGKPKSEEEARAMLARSRGRTHRVYTGVSVSQGEKCFSTHRITEVTFGKFSDAFIAKYVATGEPMDKAGAYAAQGKGALLIEKIEGDYFNVVGLPLFALGQLLREFGVEIEEYWAE